MKNIKSGFRCIITKDLQFGQKKKEKKKTVLKITFCEVGKKGREKAISLGGVLKGGC